MGNKRNGTIRYFGYGANSSDEMIETIIGRKPSGISARLENYELLIQSWNGLTPEAQKILGKQWDANFRTYSIRPKYGKVVVGHIWFLTPAERKQVSRWEFWYKPIKVRVQLATGKIVEAETEMVTEIVDVISGGEVVDGESYPDFLNDKNEMLRVAAKIRRHT